jgi:hypothetical protein
MRTTVRRLAVLALVASVALGGLAGVAAAGNHGGADSSVTVEVDLDAGAADGEGAYDCEGDVTLDHDCDKEGELDAVALSIDYEGDNRATPSERTGGGGDAFVVWVGDRTATVGFECDFGPEPPQENPCPADASADQRGGP